MPMLPPREPDRRPVADMKVRPSPVQTDAARSDSGRLVLKPRLRIIDRERAERVMRVLQPRGEPC